MADKRYQVVGQCAYFTQDTAFGVAKVLLMAGAPVGPGATQAEIDHNLSVGLIAEFGAAPDPQATEAGSTTPGDGGDEKTPDPVDTGKHRRAAARAKLPADGSAPGPRAARDVWVEYAVTKGMARDAAEAATLSDLQAALKT